MLRQEFPDHAQGLNKTMIDRRLRDSFYCGLWVIKKGTKQERTIDYTRLTLQDGTRFEPVVTKEEFERIQEIRNSNRV